MKTFGLLTFFTLPKFFKWSIWENNSWSIRWDARHAKSLNHSSSRYPCQNGRLLGKLNPLVECMNFLKFSDLIYLILSILLEYLANFTITIAIAIPPPPPHVGEYPELSPFLPCLVEVRDRLQQIYLTHFIFKISPKHLILLIFILWGSHILPTATMSSQFWMLNCDCPGVVWCYNNHKLIGKLFHFMILGFINYYLTIH